MSDYVNVNIKAYLEDLSARKSVPGGGSAAALAAAAGASLNLMVLRFSRDKDGDMPAGFQEPHDIQSAALKNLTAYVDRDCEAFSGLMKALREKRAGDGEYRQAATIPLMICRECHRSMGVSRMLLERSNKNLVSDIGCAASLLGAAFVSARINVYINMKHMKDPDFTAAAERELSDMEKDIREAQRQIVSEVDKRIAGKDDDG